MPGIFIAPANFAGDQADLERSIVNAIDRQKIIRNFSDATYPELIDIERHGRGFYAWGLRPDPEDLEHWFQMGVGEWRQYVGTSSGDNQLQAGTEITRRWTMPTGGLIAGAQPPTENTLALPLLWKLDSDIDEQKFSANRFRVRLTLQEQTAL